MGLSNGHWSSEQYKETMTRKQVREMLIERGDQLIFRGRLRKLKIRHIAAGVYEVSKEPLKEDLNVLSRPYSSTRS
jgi:hypothetical protein